MNKNEKLISVIIPTYNREKTIIRAVDSVLSQTYKNIEIIVVDDNSKDQTISLLEKINDHRIKIIKLNENHGACHARNVGIENAKGDYIAFQDSDDEWLEDKLEIQLKHLLESKSDMIFCQITRIDGNKKVIIPDNNFKMSNIKEEVTKQLLIDNCISTQSILAKRKVFEDIKFDEKFPRFQDWDLVLRISQKYKIDFINKALVNLYLQNDSLTKNIQKGVDALLLLNDKYKNIIENDDEIRLSFLKKICKFKFNNSNNCAKEAKEYLKLKFDLKIFMIFIIDKAKLTKVFNFSKRILKKILKKEKNNVTN